MTTIREALQQAYQRLSASSTPRLDAQVLLCHLLHVEKVYLVAHDDRVLSDEEAVAYQKLVERRAMGEPIAYILGTKGFYGLEFIVTPAVLIPRPETEHLIDAALQWAGGKSSLIAVDIGTGSGAIAVTLANLMPQAVVHAVDISQVALDVARQNVARHEVSIHLHQGYLAQPLIDAAIRVDLLLANLPYIRHAELSYLKVSQQEPHLALDGGADGLDLIRALLCQIPDVCHPGALILLEIGAEQGQAVANLAAALNPRSVEILKDYAGHDRVLRIEL